MTRRTKGRTRFREIVLTHLRHVKGRLFLSAICTLGIVATELLKPWPLKVILDHIILDKQLPRLLQSFQQLFEPGKYKLLVVSVSCIILVAIFAGFFSYFQIFMTSSIGYKFVYALRRELFSHLQRLSLSFHNRARSGDLLTKIAGDTNTLKDVFTDSLLKITAHLLTVMGMFAIMFAVNWQISLIALATFPFLCYSLFHVYRKTKASVKMQRKQEGKLASRMNEVFSAISLVQAFAREKHEEEQFDSVTAQTLEQSIRVARLEAVATRSTELITAVGTAGAMFFGALEVLNGNMIPGELLLFSFYLTNMYKPIRNLAKLSTDFSKAMASAERISEILELEPEIADAPDAVEAGKFMGEVAFEGVSFDYGAGKPALSDISFIISPGQRLALVGASGAGKSTILSLILRLYDPQTGFVSIDGVNIKQYRLESLRRQVGIVLQDSVLFGATIRENIAYGKPDATLGEIVSAAQAANADEFISQLEHGYETYIGERGSTLSGGQRQRIAIARALIRETPILVLDEPMTGLDVESELKVREALDRLMAGRTCLMITHDLMSVAGADLVLLLDDGRILEQGKHGELVKTSSRYRQLYELSIGSHDQVQYAVGLAQILPKG